MRREAFSRHISHPGGSRRRRAPWVFDHAGDRKANPGEVCLSPSTLYSAIKRLLEAGFIAELSERPDPAHDDERRRYYRITKAGRHAAIEEARQLDQLLADARSTGLVPRRI